MHYNVLIRGRYYEVLQLRPFHEPLPHLARREVWLSLLRYTVPGRYLVGLLLCFPPKKSGTSQYHTAGLFHHIYETKREEGGPEGGVKEKRQHVIFSRFSALLVCVLLLVVVLLSLPQHSPPSPDCRSKPEHPGGKVNDSIGSRLLTS